MDAVRHYGWLGTIKEYIDTPEEAICSALKDHHKLCMNMDADPSQLIAWHNCIISLKQQMAELVIKYPKVSNWAIIFEYELPRERGRRPDVIILSDKDIFALELKGYQKSTIGFIDQVSAYARDIQNYHAESHDKNVHPLLILTISKDSMFKYDDVWVSSPTDLVELFTNIIDFNAINEMSIDPLKWVDAEYAPLPSLVSAARKIFQNEPLPHIKSVERADIDGTINELLKIAKKAKDNNEIHLALVTGVPGAGKTLVGLKFVYENYFGDTGGHRTAVFLSGNKPLVAVLQHALKNKIFVQGVHDFLKQYGGANGKSPEENVWIYDEAQRAWDSERVLKYRGHNTSEPEDFLKLSERRNSWALMIGLIGEGQEIHLGEEAGLKQWNDAILKISKPLIVNCPSKVAGIFTNAKEVNANEKLDLTISLRSHLAEDVQLWVKLVLEGKLADAMEISKKVHGQGFEMYITRDLESAKQYASDRYKSQIDKTYGYLASSKAKNISKYGIRNEYNYTKNLRVGPWYNDDPSSKFSCCQFNDVATEFSCQGLELDFPVIGWGDDLKWNVNKWASIPQPRSQAHDPHQLRINSYRVLLSRGRDGFIIFVPDEKIMDSTYQALLNSGVKNIQNEMASMNSAIASS